MTVPTRFARRGASLLWLALLASCMPAYPAPDPGRLACLNSCGRQKDSCMVAATSANAIQACDTQSASCNATCPS